MSEYNEFLTRQKKLVYPRAAESNPDNLLVVSVNPFGFAVDPANEVFVDLSQRVDQFSTLNTVKTACNISNPAGGSARRLTAFRPAKATVFYQTTVGSTSPATSQITSIPYQKRNGDSYTYPYGAAGTERENDTRTDILTAANAIAGASVSFRSEKL